MCVITFVIKKTQGEVKLMSLKHLPILPILKLFVSVLSTHSSKLCHTHPCTGCLKMSNPIPYGLKYILFLFRRGYFRLFFHRCFYRSYASWAEEENTDNSSIKAVFSLSVFMIHISVHLFYSILYEWFSLMCFSYVSKLMGHTVPLLYILIRDNRALDKREVYQWWENAA